MTHQLKLNAFLPSRGETCFNTLDGSDVAAWLRKNGHTVIGNYDTGRNGLAVTVGGVAVSTNGYVSKAEPGQVTAALRSVAERAIHIACGTPQNEARNPFAWS